MKTPQMILACITSVMLSACGATTGLAARSNVSTFDGSTAVWIQPHSTNCDMSLVCSAVGAEWHSDRPDSANLIIETSGSYASIDGCVINIDGRIVALSPDAASTRYSNDQAERTGYANPGFDQLSRTSTRYFNIPLATVREMATAASVKMRVRTSEVTIDSVIMDGAKDSKARFALQRFLAEVATKQPH